MTRMLIALTAAAILSSGQAAAKEPASCGVATLDNVEVLTDLIALGTITTVRDRTRKPGERDWFAVTTPSARLRKRYHVTVRLANMIYTGESPGDAFWNFDPTRLVINDVISACVDEKHLTLRRPDGKDYQTTIVRALRAVSPS